MSKDLIKWLRFPPFGTEASERNVMMDAADRIEELEISLREIAEGYETPWSMPTMSNLFAVGAILSERINIARKALENSND
jgi:hypothetical protein